MSLTSPILFLFAKIAIFREVSSISHQSFAGRLISKVNFSSSISISSSKTIFSMVIESASTCDWMYSLKSAIASSNNPLEEMRTEIRSVISKSLDFRRFWILLISSRAIPSFRSSSVTVMSYATVSRPSLPTSQPGMSSDRISTSASSTLASSPLMLKVKFPSFSSRLMSALFIS